MIKFFRSIRRNLVETPPERNRSVQAGGKTIKYLKYAIGEIILVMIGILLALQVNNWSERRKDSDYEKKVLAAIHEEFTENKKQFATIKKWYQGQKRKVEFIISQFPITDANWEAIRHVVVVDSAYIKPKVNFLEIAEKGDWGIFTPILFDPVQSSLNALINSSSMNLIKNEKLRNTLNSWSDLIQDYRRDELNQREIIFNQVHPFVNDHLNFYYPSNDYFDDRARRKFEILVHRRNWGLTILSEGAGFNKVERIEQAMDSIIKWTKPYAE